MGIELFERAAAGGGQLLRAEVRPLDGRGDRVSALLLTFDLGRIAVAAEPATSRLAIEYVPSRDDVGGLEDASEEEPWWRLLGSPLARAWPAGPDGKGGLYLQFRASGQSPRVVALEPRGGSVAIRLERPEAVEKP
jgi:hypothetical protein